MVFFSGFKFTSVVFSATETGMEQVKLLSALFVLVTRICPPINSINLRVMASPRPVPGLREPALCSP